MHRPDLDQLRAHVNHLPAGPLRELVPRVLDYVEEFEGLLRPPAQVGDPVPQEQWARPYRAIADAVQGARALFPPG